MTGLADCIARAAKNILPKDGEALLSREQELIASGMPEIEAGRTALSEFQAQAEQDLDDIAARIEEAGGSVNRPAPPDQVALEQSGADEQPWLGYVAKDGKAEHFNRAQGEEADWHHSMAVESLDDYDADGTMRYVRYGDEAAVAISGELALDPYGRGRKQIAAIAETLLAAGADPAITIYVDDMALGHEMEGVTVGRLSDFAPEGVEQKVTEQATLEQAAQSGYEGRDTGEAAEWVAAVEKGLDMSQEARMARAREMGFDTGNVWYHGTDSQNIEEFQIGRPSKRFTTFSESDIVSTGLFVSASQEDAQTYGDNVMPLFVREGNRLLSPRDVPFSSKASKAEKDKMEKLFDDIAYILEPEIDESGYIDTDGGISSIKTDPDGDWISNIFTEDGIEWSYLDNPEVVDRMKERGYDSIKVYEPNDETGSSLFLTDPSQLRSTSAAFDPDNAASPNILAQGATTQALEGAPRFINVPGRGETEFGIDPRATAAAEAYAAKAGVDYRPLTEYEKVSVERAEKIAREFDLMEHNPTDPEVVAAYDAMIAETLAQFDTILDTGLEIEFIRGEDPYSNTPREAILDVVENNHLFVYSTRDGFGSSETFDPVDNPLLRETDYEIGGEKLLANDVFRIVHDYFGHIKNGNGFRAAGEENAWQAHAAMYTPLARRAMTTETRGQNSWVNYGPNGETNRTSSAGDTIYADQKIGLLPEWVSNEARQSDQRQERRETFQAGLQGAIREDGRLELAQYGDAAVGRTTPDGDAFFGIPSANENGYRVSASDGAVANFTSIDPVLVYPLEADPDGLAVTTDDGIDVDATVAALKAAGYSGFRVNEESTGQVAHLWDPMQVEESKPASDGPRSSRHQQPTTLNQSKVGIEKKWGVPLEFIVRSRGKVSGKPSVLKALNAGNLEKNATAMDALAADHPDPLGSITAWNRMERQMLGDNEHPAPPKGLIEKTSDMEGWINEFSTLTEGQREAAAAGFEDVKALNELYESGEATSRTTAKLMLWGMLSRMLSTHPHEAAFIDAATSEELDGFIDLAFAREWTKEDVAAYREWSMSTMPEGSPGRSGTSNLNDFGGLFLKKMSVRKEDGRSALDHLHDLIADRSIASADVRRQFYTLAGDVGIKNKVLSFVMLLTGRDDVVVLDRIQINSMWDAASYGRGIYDEVADLFEGAQGLVRYEALERSLVSRMEELYAGVGRPEDASVGRYHWESWVLNSGQVVAHPTIRGLINEVQGKDNPFYDIVSPEGRFHQYAYGARYGVKKDGSPFVLYNDSSDNVYEFTPTEFKGMIAQAKKASNGVIPKGFSVKSFYNKGIPWYEDEQVNREALDALVQEHGKRAPKSEQPAQADGVSSDADGARQGSEVQPHPTLDQPAYHGTPHKFDRFSLEAIGTGEGAQAYGWGLYFAGKRGIAEYYKEALTPWAAVSFNGSEYHDSVELDGLVEALEEDHEVSFDRALRDLVSRIRKTRSAESARIEIKSLLGQDDLQKFSSTVEGLRRELIVLDAIEKNTAIEVSVDAGEEGSLYQADIPDDGDLFTWDGPAGDAQGAVSEKLNKAISDSQNISPADKEDLLGTLDSTELTGEDFYDALSSVLGGDREASLFMSRAGVPGLKYLDRSSRRDGEGTYNYVIWDEEAITIEAVNDQVAQAAELAQGKAQPGEQPRASISLFPNRRVINLTERSDPSSFIHEAGHLFLDMETVFAKKYGVNQNQRNLLDWLGVKSFDDIDLNTPEGVEMHEKFARAFEAYLYEGKAPSMKLKAVFNDFRNWLRRVYSSILALDVELDDSIRQVFDRLLASEEEIAEASNNAAYENLFNDIGDSAMSEAAWADYVAQGKKAKGSAQSKVDQEVLEHYTRLATKKWRDEEKALREDIEARLKASPEYELLQRIKQTPMDRDALREAMGLPARTSPGDRARGKTIDENDSLLVAAAKAGGLNMAAWQKDGVDPALLKDKLLNNQVFGSPVFRKDKGMLPDDLAEFASQFGYGENLSANEVIDLVHEELSGTKVMTLAGQVASAEAEANYQEIFDAEQHEAWLIRRVNSVTKADGGVNPEAVAEQQGFETVQEMMDVALKIFSPREQAKLMAEEEMLQRHGDILNDGTIEAKVQEALHDVERSKVLLMELKALNQTPAQKSAKVERQQLKNMARDTIGGLRYQQIRPDKYRRAEVKAAIAASEAVKKGQRAEALKQKRLQIGNFYLYREARKAQTDVEKQRRYVEGVKGREYSVNQVAAPFVAQMKALSAVYDTRKTADRTKLFSGVVAWFDGQLSAENTQFDLAMMDDRVIRGVQAYRDNGQSLPADFVIPTWKDLTVDDMKGLYDQIRHLRYVGGQMADNNKAAFKRKLAPLVESILSNKKKDFKERFEGANRRQRGKDYLDQTIGGLAGVFNHLRKLDGFEDGGVASQMLYGIIHDATNRKRALNDKVLDTMKREMEGLSNLGIRKTDKRQFVDREGKKFPLSAEARFMFAVYWGTDSSREALLEGHKITSDVAQEIMETLTEDQLKMVNSIWKVNESMASEFFGVATKVLGVAPEKIAAAPFVVNGVEMTGGHMQLFYDASDIRVSEEADNMVHVGKIMPNRNGSTINRVGSGGRRVLLDKSTIRRSIDQKIHWMAFAEAGKELNAILTNPEVKAAIEKKHGEMELRSLASSLEGIVGNREVMESNKAIVVASRWLRGTATAKHLMFSLRNVVQQVGSLLLVQRDIGTLPLIKAMVLYASGHGPDVAVKSSFMANRKRFVNREANEFMSTAIPDGMLSEFTQRVTNAGFLLQTMVDTVIATPAWSAKYEMEMLAHGDEKRAVMAADILVSETVGSGADEHLGQYFQRHNNEWIKTMTVFGTWFNAYYQRVYRDSKGFTEVNWKVVDSAIITPVILATITQMLIADIPEDDEELPEWFWDNYFAFITGIVPVVRDLASISEGFTPTTPLAAGAMGVYDLAVGIPKAAFKGDKTAQELTIRGAKRVTDIVPVPVSGQVIRAVEGMLDPNQESLYAKIVEGKQRN